MATEKEANIKLAKEAFIRLRKRANLLQIENKHLTKLNSVRGLKRQSYRALVYVLISAFILPTVLYVSYKSLHEETRQRIMKTFADKVLDIDLQKEMCLIPSFEFYLDLFRPPVDCSVCENVETVDSVTGLSKEEFLKKYAYTSRPVIIRNGCKNWTASSHFNFEFFKSIYPSNSPALQSVDRDCQFFPYRTKFESLGEVFNMSESMSKMKGDPWYIGW